MMTQAKAAKMCARDVHCWHAWERSTPPAAVCCWCGDYRLRKANEPLPSGGGGEHGIYGEQPTEEGPEEKT